MAVLRSSSNVFRVLVKSQRASPARLLSSSSSIASSSQKPPPPAGSTPNTQPATPPAKDEPITPGEEQDGKSIVLPSLDFDPASEPKPSSTGRTGARSAKGSLSSLERKRKNMIRMTLASMAIGTIAGFVYMGREWEEDEKNSMKNVEYSNSLEAYYGRFKARFGETLDYYNKPAWEELIPLPPHKPYTLVLSLDDLLITSTWDRQHGWRTAKRPGVDYFIAYLSQFYEIVVFTSQYDYTANPVLEKLDPYTNFIAYRLFRESTRSVSGKIVKDLSYLNRDLSKVVMIDTHSDHCLLQPENTILLPKWKGDAQDKGLVNLIPFLESIGILHPADVRPILKACEGKDIARLHAQREAEMKQRALEEWNKGKQGKKHAPSSHGVGGLRMGSLLGASSSGAHFDPSLPPPTYLEIKRAEAQEYYLNEQKWIKENEETFKRAAEADRQRAMEIQGGTLMGMLTGAPPPPPAAAAGSNEAEKKVDGDKDKEVRA